MNKVFIVGRLTKAPDLKTTPNDISVATFTVAVTRQAGKESDFLNVVAWRELAENCAKYLVKGQQAAVCGELRTRSYDAKDGSRRYVTEILAEDVEFLARPKGAERREEPSGMWGAEEPAPKDDDWDDLPF